MEMNQSQRIHEPVTPTARAWARSPDVGQTEERMRAYRLSFSTRHDRMSRRGAAGPVPAMAPEPGRVANIAKRRMK